MASKTADFNGKLPETLCKNMLVIKLFARAYLRISVAICPIKRGPWLHCLGMMKIYLPVLLQMQLHWLLERSEGVITGGDQGPVEEQEL